MLVYQLVEIRKILDKVSSYEGIDFAYVVFKNKQIIDKKMMEVEFIKNVSQEVIEYEESRIKFCEEYSKKNTDGKSIIENDIYLIQDNLQDEFKIKMDDLYEKYKTHIDERRQQIEIFNNKMNEECDLKFYKLKKEEIPPQINTAEELEKISFMIE